MNKNFLDTEAKIGINMLEIGHFIGSIGLKAQSNSKT